MQRQSASVAVWLAATIAATVVVWLGVRVVDGQVTGQQPVALDGAGPAGPETTTVTTAPPATVPQSDSTVAVPPTSPPGGPSPTQPSGLVTRTVNGEGGSVTIRQTATTVELVVATPNEEYAAEIAEQGPDEVRVRFRSGDDVTDIRAFPGNAPPEVQEGGEGPD